MEAADVVEILDRLESAAVEAWLDGGWGVDALLGEQTREHADLDLIVRVIDVAGMRRALGGFQLIDGEPDRNFVLRGPADREVDVHTVTFDELGNGLYVMSDGGTWVYPSRGFDGRGTIGGRPVPCLTPEVQMLCHAGGYEPHDSDFHDMQRLHTRFGTALVGPYAGTEGVILASPWVREHR